MRLPPKVYRLYVSTSGDQKLRWSEIGSKTYNSRQEAEKRLFSLRSRGIDCELFESQTLEWTQISTTPALDGQAPLW